MAQTRRGLPRLPDRERRRLIDRLTKYIAGSFRARAEGILNAPEQYDPGISEVRWQICGTFAYDLDLDFGDDIEAMILAAYQQAGLPTSVPTQEAHPPTKSKAARSRPVKRQACP